MRGSTVTVSMLLLLSLISLMMLNSVSAADADSDGVDDEIDLCPNTEIGKTVDSNGCADNQLDSDGDGINDEEDACSPGGEQEWTSTPSSDQDGDGCKDSTEDDDDDNDGVNDGSDNCPNEYGNSTQDSVGCLDTDGDGWSDSSDVFPDDPTERSDSDGDGFGDNSDDCLEIYGTSLYDVVGCQDTDGDGWSDSGDEFPVDGNEWADNDSDGFGNNEDDCPDEPSDSTDEGLVGCPLVPKWTVDSLIASNAVEGRIDLEWGYGGSGSVNNSTDFVRILVNPSGGVLQIQEEIQIDSNYWVFAFAQTYSIAANETNHGTYYEITLQACNEVGCNTQTASTTIAVDKEVDPYAYSTNLQALKSSEDTYSWQIDWDILGIYSDVYEWNLCWSDIEWFTDSYQESPYINCIIVSDSLSPGTSGFYDFSNLNQPTYWFVIVPVDVYGNTPKILPQLRIDIGDPDFDGFYGEEDDCPMEQGSSTGTWTGCPDSDGDGWADLGDGCPQDYGYLDGCDGDEIASGTDDGPEDVLQPTQGSASSSFILLICGIVLVVAICVYAFLIAPRRTKKKSTDEFAYMAGRGTPPAPVPASRPPAPVPAPLPPLQVPAPLPAPSPVPLTLQQRFAVAEMLAEGGMAEVYRATEKSTGQVMVWKQAHGKHNPLSVSNMKLEEEAELMKTIPHSRIPQYIAHGKITDNSGKEKVVMVQEFIEGGDLKNTVDQLMKVGASVPLEKIIEYLLAICEPLEHMTNMSEPIYHRDLKPHNVIIHPSRGPVLIDFGLAKMVATGEDMSVTRGGSGTWTPPERDSGISGPFTDVWSLGKIMFYLCTNQKPAAILAEVDMQAVYAKGHPKWVGELILKAVNPRYQDRVESVAWFKYLLNARGNWEKMGSDQAASSDDFTTWG